jgi:hypothetical protein
MPSISSYFGLTGQITPRKPVMRFLKMAFPPFDAFGVAPTTAIPWGSKKKFMLFLPATE